MSLAIVIFITMSKIHRIVLFKIVKFNRKCRYIININKPSNNNELFETKPLTINNKICACLIQNSSHYDVNIKSLENAR